MEKITNENLIDILKKSIAGQESILLLNSIDKYIIFKFDKNGIIREHPQEREQDFSWDYFNDASNWLDGKLFNKTEQVNFKRINNNEFAVAQFEDNNGQDSIPKKYYLLGAPDDVINNSMKYDGWTFISEYRINGYWVPGTFTGKVYLEGKELLEKNTETGEVNVSCIKYNRFSNNE